jgi:hypothetical protein
LVAVAIAISYFDRLTLPVAIAAIQRNIPLSNEQFSWLQTSFLLSYAALYVIGGRLLDWLGTRRGFLLIMLWWSLACALHSLATGFVLLLIARFLLGAGEGGGFPAATRLVAEWIEPPERSRELLETNSLDYIQFDTNRVGGISQARKICALAESFQVPVVPHAGQMHNYHVVMASLNSPIAEFFPKVDVEVGNELFWYIFDGEPVPESGHINLDDTSPGLGLTVNEESLKSFQVIE